jgi:hypothetical protein
MDIAHLILVVAIAVMAVADHRLAARAVGRRERALAVSRELAAGLQARFDQSREERVILAEQLDHERADRRGEQERFLARTASIERAHRAQVSELLDRIQRVEVVPVAPGELVLEDRKLHWSEADEIDGLTPGQVAAAAGPDVEEALAYVDEIARSEGTP